MLLKKWRFFFICIDGVSKQGIHSIIALFFGELQLQCRVYSCSDTNNAGLFADQIGHDA